MKVDGLETITHWRKSYPVQAIQITEENIREIALECGGEYSETPNAYAQAHGVDDRSPHIYHNGAEGHPGDWAVLADPGGWDFYSDEEFKHAFRTTVQEISEDENFARVFQLVTAALSAQDRATYQGDTRGMDLVAIRTTKQILGQL